MTNRKSAKARLLLAKGIAFGRVAATSAVDFLLWILRAPAGSLTPPSSGRTIVYLGGNLPPRIARMVKWHKKSEDFESVLVCHADGYRAKYANPAIDRVLLFRNKWHLLRLLRGLRHASLFHAFGPKSRYPAAVLKAGARPFLYDMQDVLAVYYGLDPPIRWYRAELPHERYCLEHADGIISHSLEFQEAYRRYGLQKPPNLFFPLCCDDDVFETKKGTFDAGAFHVVYVGEVAGSFRDPKQFATIQFHGLAAEFEKQGIHLHLYPAPGTFAADVGEYRALERDNAFLHIHEPVHQSALAKELSQYDFGLIPFFFKDTMHSWEKFKYSTSLKLFNYIEAGIPVLCSRDIVFQHWIAARYGMAVGISKNDLPALKTMIQEIDYALLIENVKTHRHRLSLSRHLPRLLKFYRRFYE